MKSVIFTQSNGCMLRITGWVLILLLAFTGCREEKVKLASDENLTLKELLSVAPELRFPLFFNDSVLQRTESDSSLLHLPTFRSFVPDTVFEKQFPSVSKLKLYVVGKATTKEKGTYLFVKSVSGKKRTVHFYYFTEQQTYLGTMKLTDNQDPVKNVNRYCRIDSRFNIALIRERKMPTGEFWTGETIYYMDANGKMIMAMTNSNEDLSDEILGNPIDTLPRKQKYSGDYSTNSKNLVSIRDGIREKTFRFFIHFSKQNGECIGEVKGEADWISEQKGIFQDNGSPCQMEFTFTKNAVTIKEIDGCGSYRGITCFFEGSFPRVKQMKYSKNKTVK